MKKLILLLVVAGFVGCSSSKKEEAKHEAHKAHKNAEKTMDDAENEANDAKEAVEQAAEDMKSDAEEKASEYANNAEDEATDASNTAFGDYTGTEKSKVTCTNADDVRTISVLSGENGGCGVVYNKFGSDKTVAVAEYSAEYCDEVQNKIKDNLTGASFTCQ